MFVKVDRDAWVNMLLVVAVVREANRMFIQTKDGQEFMVEEAYEADVVSAMRTLETVILRFKVGSFSSF